MTVPSTARRAGPFLGNGSTTTFSFTFKTFAASDLQVVKTSTLGVDSVLVLDSDYSVSLNVDQDASPGGTITYPISGTPLATGEKLTALSLLAYEQTTDLLGGGAFNARVIEDTFDRTVIQIQQLEERLDRALSVPASSTASAALPEPAPFEVIGWDAAGTALTNIDASDFLTIAGSSGFSIQTFSGTGAQTAFTLSQNPGAIANLEVFISGVRQQPTADYTISGTTLTFISAPPAGTNNVLVRWGTTLGIGVPSDTSVTTAKLGPSAVTAAKVERVAANQVLRSTGVSSDPAWGALNLTTDVTGVLPVANGGTGLSAPGALNNVLRSDGAGAWTSTALSMLVPDATDSVKGVIELATTAEIETGTDTTRAITPAGLRGGALVRMTAQATTSGTSVDFTGIPSWVRRITVMFSGVSTSGTNGVLVQLGDAGGFETTGYASSASYGGSVGNYSSSTAGFIVDAGNQAAAATTRRGFVEIVNMDGNLWICSGSIDSGQVSAAISGSKTLSDVLTQIRITTVSGTDTFDAGSANVIYE